MATAEDGRVQIVDTATLKAWLEEGAAVLVDVREPAEHAAERIPGALLVPLSRFRPEDLPVADGKKVVLHCHSGARSAQVAVKLALAGWPEVWDFDGGISAWKAAGLPLEGTGKQPISVLRQTQLTIGTCVLLFTVLGAFLAKGFLVVPAFMGAGLIFAGTTGTCGLALLIARLPWNQRGCCAE